MRIWNFASWLAFRTGVSLVIVSCSSCWCSALIWLKSGLVPEALACSKSCLRVLCLQDALHLGLLRLGQIEQRRQVSHHLGLMGRGIGWRGGIGKRCAREEQRER
jgi:hypothetical protein